MKFPLILAGVTTVTLMLIFGVYKLFLDKPVAQSLIPKTKITSNAQTEPTESLPVALQIPAATVSPSPVASVKPKASTLKSTIGTLTVLQNNTSSQTSAAPAVAGSSTISGTISFAGTAPSGTSIVIVARPNGTGEHYKTVVSGITAVSNTKWNWTTAKLNTAYDMIAVLKGSSGGVDTDYAASQTYIINAPALNQIFSVNAASPPSAPSGTITTTCTTKANDNKWTATVNFPTVTGGEWYILKVGTTSGGTDVANVTQGVQTGSNQTVSAVLTDSVLYFAQYAVASAPNPTPYQYSPYSGAMTIKCPN